MRKSVLLRADGSERTGLGHLYRMVAMADMLGDDFDCYLVYRNGYPAVWAGNENVLSAFQLTKSENEEAAEVSGIALSLPRVNKPEDVILVLDGYGFDFTRQAEYKAEGFALVFVDDIQHTDFIADLVINHAPLAHRSDYRLADYVKTAFGLRFALLRQVFLLPPSRTFAPAATSPVFVCLGGADPDNLSVMVLALLEEKGISHPVDLVLGAAYPHQEALATFLAASRLNVTVHQQLPAREMAALMWSSAFGVTSPSTISLEYLATGKQLYLQQTADNQDAVKASLLAQKIAFPLEALTAAAEYPPNSAVGKLYDGNQAVRLRKLFAGLRLTFRPARYEDCRLLYRWATDPAVRAQSFSTGQISWAEHKAWFLGQLVRADRRFYLCEDEEGPAGLVRFSLEGETALLGYSLSTRVRGKGYGVSMVHFATERLRGEVAGVKRINAYVKKENMASCITLARLGYTELPTNDYPNALKYILDV